MRNSQLEILAQAQQYLESVIKADYIEILAPNFMSSAGSHIRHIIDHYSAIITGTENDLIDYDVRTRGSQIEEYPETAIVKINKISTWIKQLSDAQLYKTVCLSTEVSINSKNVQRVQTSIARELVFAGSHAVHHFAMITQISIAQQKPLPVFFGLAPATATHIRQQNLQQHFQ
ncbi:MAG: hypothetical protein HRT52_09185 [Colwellia sp.]|nr:hypothetical protein [Colwellia sp.]